MTKDWILQTIETRRAFSTATWVPLRASTSDEKGDVKQVGFVSEYFGLGSAAFPKDYRAFVEERLGWSDIGIGHTVAPYAYEDGYYANPSALRQMPDNLLGKQPTPSRSIR